MLTRDPQHPEICYRRKHREIKPNAARGKGQAVQDQYKCEPPVNSALPLPIALIALGEQSRRRRRRFKPMPAVNDAGECRHTPASAPTPASARPSAGGNGTGAGELGDAVTVTKKLDACAVVPSTASHLASRQAPSRKYPSEPPSRPSPPSRAAATAQPWLGDTTELALISRESI